MQEHAFITSWVSTSIFCYIYVPLICQKNVRLPVGSHFYFCKQAPYGNCDAAMHSSCMNYWKENGERFVPTEDFPTPDSIIPGSKGFTRNGPSEEEKVAVSLGENNGVSGGKCSKRKNGRNVKAGNSHHTKAAKRLCRNRQVYTDVKKRTSARNKSNTSPQKKKTKKME